MQKFIYLIIGLFLFTACNKKFDKQFQEAEKLKNEGNKQYNYKNYDSALSNFRKALQLFDSIGNKGKKSDLYYNIGACFSALNKYDSAFFYYKNAIEFNIKSGNNDSDLKKMIGQIHNYYRNYDLALKYYKEALSEADTIKNYSIIHYLYNNIGDTYRYKKMYDSALVFLNKAIKDTSKNAIPSIVYANMAITYDSLDIPKDSALFFYHKSLNLLRADKTTNSFELQASVMSSLCSLFVRQGNLDSATVYQHKIDSIFSYVKDKEFRIDILKMYSDYYEHIGEIPKAHSYLKQYYALWLTLNNEQRTVGYSVMQVELRLKENEQKQLENEAKAEKTKYIYSFVILSFALISFVSILIIYNRNKRRLQHQKHLHEIETKETTERIIYESEERWKFELSDYVHTSLAGDVRNMREIIKKSLIEEKSKVNILTRTTEILKKVRSISHELGPGSLKTGGLKDGLFDMCSEIQDIYHIKVNFICQVEERFEENFELKVYRIIQDLKNNIINHAKATEADIQLLKSGNTLKITVEDNGVGFNYKDTQQKKGIGLQNIEAKVSNLKGSVEIDSMQGEGTCVLIEIPCPAIM